jgi:hypothetical protein
MYECFWYQKNILYGQIFNRLFRYESEYIYTTLCILI